jgi:hypothetical protein
MEDLEDMLRRTISSPAFALGCVNAPEHMETMNW